MKSGSDNFRESAIQGIIKMLEKHNLEIIIYEPMLKENHFEDMKVIHNLEEFKQKSDVILVNRTSKELEDVKDKIYTRDLFSRD